MYVSTDDYDALDQFERMSLDVWADESPAAFDRWDAVTLAGPPDGHYARNGDGEAES